MQVRNHHGLGARFGSVRLRVELQVASMLHVPIKATHFDPQKGAPDSPKACQASPKSWANGPGIPGIRAKSYSKTSKMHQPQIHTSPPRLSQRGRTTAEGQRQSFTFVELLARPAPKRKMNVAAKRKTHRWVCFFCFGSAKNGATVFQLVSLSHKKRCPQ